MKPMQRFADKGRTPKKKPDERATYEPVMVAPRHGRQVLPMAKRDCGGCTVCCTILAVNGMTEAGEPCKNQCEAGCAIYAERPRPCRSFDCLWRLGVGEEDDRPDKSGVMFTPPRFSQMTQGAVSAAMETTAGAAEGPGIAQVIADIRATGVGVAIVPPVVDGEKQTRRYLPPYKIAQKIQL